MGKTLGGSIFIHNAIEFDYCLKESLQSLCGVCDEVVVMDCESTDGTTELILNLTKEMPKLKAITGIKWECTNNYTRLARLATQAKSYLNTEWHFMLQADEVLHENSYPFILKAINEPFYKSYYARRLNFFADYNHYIKIDQPNINKPCGDIVCRLATIEHEAGGDAESLVVDPVYLSPHYLDDIVIYHYGYVRRDEFHIKKVLSMQSWFWGEGSQPDSRVVEMNNKGNGVYDWTMMKTREMLSRHDKIHPFVATEYVRTRQLLKTIMV